MMTFTITPDQFEQLARAGFEAWESSDVGARWEDVSESERDADRAQARAILDLLGVVVQEVKDDPDVSLLREVFKGRTVKIEGTDAMLDEAYRVYMSAWIPGSHRDGVRAVLRACGVEFKA